MIKNTPLQLAPLQQQTSLDANTLPLIASPRTHKHSINQSLLNPNITAKDFKSKLDDLYEKLNDTTLNSNRPLLLSPLANIPNVAESTGTNKHRGLKCNYYFVLCLFLNQI